jgi:sugar phosphate permease
LIKASNGTLQSFSWACNFGILCNWFPRKGRGIVIGVWATCCNVGDIIGEQLYRAFAGGEDQGDQWGYTFIVLGIMVFVVGFLNFLFLIEYPHSKGIKILENSSILQVS